MVVCSSMYIQFVQYHVNQLVGPLENGNDFGINARVHNKLSTNPNIIFVGCPFIFRDAVPNNVMEP